MGIKDYVKFIKKTYPDACKKEWLRSYTRVYVDLNHILHRSVYKSESLNDVITKSLKQLDEIIRNHKIKKIMHVMGDGTAPIAKMLLQRKRRFEKVMKAEAEDEDNILSIHFTSGTKFTNNLEKIGYDYAKKIKQIYNIEVFFDVKSCDEGELKIKREVMRNLELYPDDTHLIISNDADMILLLACMSNNDNLYHAVDDKTIISIKKLFESHINTYVNLPTPIYILNDSKNMTFELVNIDYYKESIVNDFVFLSLLFGNDYFPKVQYINYDNVWNAYSKCVRHYKPGLIDYDRENHTIKINQIFMFDLITCMTSMNKVNYDKRYDFRSHRMNKNKYDKYVEGIAWCFDMYKTGNCINCQYIYDCYPGPPHYISILLSIINNNVIKIEPKCRIDSDLYTILLIPEKFNSVLTDYQKHISKKLLQEHPSIYEEEHCQICKSHSEILTKSRVALKKINKKINNNNDNCENENEDVNSDISSIKSSDFDNLTDSDDDVSDDLKNDLENDDVLDNDKYMKKKKFILSIIRNYSLKYSDHKLSHTPLDLIETLEIVKSYNKITGK